MRKIYKAGVYASLKSDDDTRVTKYQEMTQTIAIVDSALSQKLSFITPEILSEDYEKIKTLLEEKEEVKEYEHYFEDMFRNKDHVLSEDQEKIIASFSKLSENPVSTYMIFSNADMKFPSVEKDGEEISLSDANFTLLEEDKDRDSDKDDDEDPIVATLARLSNYTIRTHNRAYINETSLVAANIWDGLIKRLFRVY